MLIFAGIVLVVSGLLCCPVTLLPSFSDGFSIRITYLFFSKRIQPGREKPKEKKQKKKAEKESETESTVEKLRRLSGEEGTAGFVSLLWELSVLAAGSLKKLFRHVVIVDFSLDVSVGGDDAADTALSYGKLCSVIYPAVSVLVSHAKTKHYGVSVFPDFTERAKTKIRFNAKARIKPWFLLLSIFAFTLGFLHIIMQKRKQSAQ